MACTPITPEKIPKPVLRAREAFQTAGKDITVDTIKDVLSKKDYNSLATLFRQTMTPQVKPSTRWPN